MILTYNINYILTLTTMANLIYVISGLDMLEDYPDVKEYIKNFDRAGCFMVKDPHYNAEIEKQMDNILNANGMHSGSSWGAMLCGIKDVLNGDYIIEKKFVNQERKYNEFIQLLEKEKNLYINKYNYEILLNLLFILMYIYNLIIILMYIYN